MFPWLPLAGMGLGLAGGLMDKFGSKNKGEVGVTESQWFQPPRYSTYDPLQETSQNFLNQQIQGIGRGEAPAWAKAYEPYMRSSLERDLGNTYYGRPGERNGLFSEAESMGARTGMGAGSTAAYTQRQMDRYREDSQKVREYIAGKMFDETSKGAYQFPQLAAGQVAGPPGMMIPGTPYDTRDTSPSWGSIMGGIGGMLPWLGMGQGTGAVGQAGGVGASGMAGPVGSAVYGQPMGSPMVSNTGGGFNWGNAGQAITPWMNTTYPGAFSGTWAPTNNAYNYGKNLGYQGAQGISNWASTLPWGQMMQGGLQSILNMGGR